MLTPLSLTTSLAALIAQTPGQGVAPEPATTYEPRYGEVMALEPRADRVASVTTPVLKRDVAQFTLESGMLYLLSPVGGRTVGAVFQGRGTFSFTPPTRIEQDRLVRFQKSRSLEAPFTQLVLLFADTTLAELGGKLTFEPGNVPGDLRSLVKKSLEHLGNDDSQSFDPDLMAAFLNGEPNDLFYAHINRDGGGPLMFMLNPFEFEGITLASRAPRIAWTRVPEVICRFPRQGTALAAGVAAERQEAARIRDYRLEVTLTQTGTGEISFGAAARLRDHHRLHCRPLGSIPPLLQARGRLGAMGGRCTRDDLPGQRGGAAVGQTRPPAPGRRDAPPPAVLSR